MFDWITGLIDAFGAVGVAVLMFLENLFPPIPSELVMPLAGYLAAGGRMSPVLVVLAGTFGSVLGAWIWFELGRRWGEARFMQVIDRWGAWATLSREDAEQALAWFRRRGAWAVFLGRLVPGVRTLISVPAGLADLPLRQFLILTFAGSLIWVSTLTAAGYLLQANYHIVEAWLDPATTILIVVILAVYVWRVWRLRHRRR